MTTLKDIEEAVAAAKQVTKTLSGAHYMLRDIAVMAKRNTQRAADAEAQLAEARDLLQATWGMGFYFVDEDSGETHRDVSKRVEALLKALAGEE